MLHHYNFCRHCGQISNPAASLLEQESCPVCGSEDLEACAPSILPLATLPVVEKTSLWVKFTRKLAQDNCTPVNFVETVAIS
ncbi:hypothetical protein K4A83_01295 [Spirulina subsalsa FACHB-351]|uniref:Rubredoxin n=1 Tax=Spirulina subsalsa FACHB-351 TaxID=234711 RepID=A0ABT3L086_9CYAN|nr:hypothetical protein [Spirulina subsalsa]MCW6034911.1 hypothetical protein [Spirulina subsalsa FACHB-351]